MIPMMNKSVLASTPQWVVFLLVLGLSAASAAEKKDRAELRFAAMAAPAGLGKLVMVREEVRSAPFELPVNFLSEAQASPARIFRLELEDREKAALCTVTLPAEGDAFVILLVPGLDSVFDAVVIPARSETFRPGDYYLHNVSKKPVMGRVGTTRFTITSREGKVVRPKGARDGRFYDVILGVRENESSRVISESRWPTSNHNRTYVFFFDNPQRNDIDFRAIDEFVAPREDR